MENLLAIDYGTRQIGLAIAINGIISPIEPIKNDQQLFKNIEKIVRQYQINQIYVGISSGPIVTKIQSFINRLSDILKLPVETAEEAVSTIEAGEIFKTNLKKKKKYRPQIDSMAAAVILRRIIG